MKYFNHKNQNDETKGPRILGQIFLASGLLVILVAFFVELDTDPLKIALVAGGALFIGFIFASIKSGTLIDFRNNQFKEYKNILWFSFGEWKVLPQVGHVELIHHSFRSSYIPNGITPTLNGIITRYKVVLLVNNKKFLVLDYSKEKDAVIALEKIKMGFGI
ncbi:hypothetical protein J2X69_000852 [Algoriphagus sp. 4150]|uniref:hypothetical protein n=1 Tax=Algoriphagus sp. 4150 TaxID=2817756 RepID=UPI00285F5253|nr:hypothetical protein [Algoriphagus sp. 4150]MDR7128520.1 hypothetical protein [Algoriphagus sp. 4150]